MALELLDAHRKLLRGILPKHNGKEIKTVGDAFLVEFSSALEATRCAYNIQQSMRELNLSLPQERKIALRIGIHLGDVIHQENDVYGDAVNVASRIAPQAQPGEICLTQQVYDHVHNKFELPFVKLGRRELKNVQTPTDIYKMTFPWESKSSSSGGATQLDKHRLAVLPLANMISDQKDEYFAEGMTEELISTVSKIGGLSVISRTSIIQYKNTAKRLPEIGRELNVGTVLEGSVRKAGNRVRISVQLIDVEGDKHLWAENYDRELQDIFAIQSDIAQKVADSLRVRLLSPEKQNLEKIATTSTEAHTLYLKGRYFFNERTEQQLKKALDFFKLATEKDPKYALAYSGMADCYSVLADHGHLSYVESIPNAKDLALKALQIDNDLAEAHASLGLALDSMWDFDGSILEFETAVELNPNYAAAHHWYAVSLSQNTKTTEAIAEAERALELDPLSVQINTFLGLLYFEAGDEERAIAKLKSTAETWPDFPGVHYWLATVYTNKRMFEEAIQESERTSLLSDGLYGKSILGIAYAKAGMTNKALELIEELKMRSKERYLDPTFLASIYSGLGMKEEAFQWLDKAYLEHASGLRYLLSLRWFDNLRSDERFNILLRNIGF